MNFEMNTWGDYSSADAVDHWLDDALRAVPLPDGFFERLSRLSDSPPERADDRDHDGHLAPNRGVAGTSRRLESSTRKIRPY